MTQNKKLLSVRDLKVSFYTEDKEARAVNGVSYDIYENEIFGLVGESGSGKSVSALSTLKLIPQPPGKILSGSVLFEDKDLLQLSFGSLRKIRGNKISMIFQEPVSSLNPVFTIGDQLSETLITHKNLSKKEALKESAAMLRLTGIPDADKRLNDYPHQLSGGMCQRVMIAMALLCGPRLLIADEPTTALDVTIQAQILSLMTRLKEKYAGSSIMLITHDLAVVAQVCGRVAVMYAGYIQEEAPVKTLFKEPLHPYTKGLLLSIPRVNTKQEKLKAIKGSVPDVTNLPLGCPFHPRCESKMKICESVLPDLIKKDENHSVRCHLYSKGSL